MIRRLEALGEVDLIAVAVADVLLDALDRRAVSLGREVGAEGLAQLEGCCCVWRIRLVAKQCQQSPTLVRRQARVADQIRALGCMIGGNRPAIQAQLGVART
ncbi:hypothetical protein, partial [Salmonella enterica]|uniref:hypothetical protein n=1 Tax=Salmonella enterica TaxID=28901 RepID=UPI0020B14619